MKIIVLYLFYSIQLSRGTRLPVPHRGEPREGQLAAVSLSGEFGCILAYLKLS